MYMTRRPAPGPTRAPQGAPHTRPGSELASVIGNRAFGRLLSRYPDAKEVRRMWEEHWASDKLKDEDCARACSIIAHSMGIKAKSDPLFRVSRDDDAATPKEAKDAYSRGWKYRDRVQRDGAREVMKVHIGSAAKGAPKIRKYPLLPGMLIYTAESAGWKDEKKTTYRWYARHMQMYGGDGVVFENFVDPVDPRVLLEGAPDEDEYGAYSPKTGRFLTTLSIYDPFAASRTEEEKKWIEGFAP